MRARGKSSQNHTIKFLYLLEVLVYFRIDIFSLNILFFKLLLISNLSNKQMGVAAVAHLYAFPAAPYKRGERCVRNVAVMTNYASLGAPPDPEEVRDCERTTRICRTRHDEREKRLNFPQSVRDVVVGSGEIVRCKFSSLYFFILNSFLH